MSRGLLTADEAVELLTVRKTRPAQHRVDSVLARLHNQRDRKRVVGAVAAYWAPLPARAKARKRPEPVWGPGVQLELLPVGQEVGF